MRIVININRITKGNRHGKIMIRTFYDTDLADDMLLNNAGVELYNLWTSALEGGVPDAEIHNEGKRK